MKIYLIILFQAAEGTVGFVGLGNMGGHMARNLLKKGYPVIAYDVSQDNLAALKADGNVYYTYKICSRLLIFWEKFKTIIINSIPTIF